MDLITRLLAAETAEERKAILAEITDSTELTTARDELVAELDELLDAESDDFARMTALADAKDAIEADDARRIETAAEAAAERQRIRDRVHGAADDEVDPADEVEPAPAAELAPEPIITPAAEPELVTAAVVAAARPSAAATRRRAPRPTLEVEPERPKVSITASADVPGYANAAELSVDDVARAMHKRARGMADGGPRASVAQIHLPIDQGDFAEMSHSKATDAVVKRIADAGRPTRFNGDTAKRGIAAAGGWCTPSDPLWDIFTLDTAGGLFTLPTIGMRHGGISVPGFMGINNSAVNGALWSWNEALDADIVNNVTNKALTANVATLTTADAHNLAVGSTVKVAINDPVFDGTFVVTAVTATTFSYARVNANVVSVATTGTSRAQKGCIRVPCPTWADSRQKVEGLCVTHGNLTDAAWPEQTDAFVDLVVGAHLQRLSSAKLADVIATIDAVNKVTIATGPSSAASELLSAIEMQVQDYRSQYLLSDSVQFESVFPAWAYGVCRADLSMRNGVDLLSITDAQIAAWFAQRGVRPQFVLGYQPLFTGTLRTAWPTSIKFLMWPAGGYVEGSGPTIDLGVTRDSSQNAENDFTAAWSEQAYAVAQRGPDAREVTVTILVDGTTGN